MHFITLSAVRVPSGSTGVAVLVGTSSFGVAILVGRSSFATSQDVKMGCIYIS
jgi:hypothetical protein